MTSKEYLLNKLLKELGYDVKLDKAKTKKTGYPGTALHITGPVGIFSPGVLLCCFLVAY